MNEHHEFNLTLDTNAQFGADVGEDKTSFGANISENELFGASIGDSSDSLNMTLSKDDAVFEARFGNAETVHTERVTSVNGMVGDVVLHIPEVVSELENDIGYITDTGMESLSNLEIEALLTEG